MYKTVIHDEKHFFDWWLAQRQSTMSLDLEGTSLDYLEFELEGFSLSSTTHACYVVRHGSEWVIEALADVVEYLDVTVMHNAVFDMKMMHKYGIEPRAIWCTMTAAKLLNENRGKGEYGLKSLAVSVLEIPADQVKKWEEVESGTPEFYDYAINDAVWTYMLYDRFLPMLKNQDLIYLFQVVEMPFQYVLADLERHGVLIDKEMLNRFKPQVENLLFKLEVLMLAEIGMEHDVCEVSGVIELVSPINLNSSQQLSEVAEGILGLKITERTRRSKKFPKGQKSVDKFTIARLAPKCEFFTLLSRYRKLGTLYRTFLNPCEHFIGLDGRIRATYQMIRTGRLSCSRPNLQNLPNPKKEKLEFNHRLMFIPAKGYVFVKADWSGQELRVLAEESQDECMIDAFKRNMDLHLLTANRIFDLHLPDVALIGGNPENKEAKNKFAGERHKAKNGVNFPIIYGKGVKTLATDFNITVEEAQRWMDSFFALYPKVKLAMDLTKLELQKQQFVVTMMGRRRRFPSYNQMSKWERAAALRQAFNFKIQGFSAEMMKLAGSRIRLMLLDFVARIVLTIHDELIYEVPQEQAKAFAVEVKYVMEHVVSLCIPIVVDVSIVNSYGD